MRCTLHAVRIPIRVVSNSIGEGVVNLVCVREVNKEFTLSYPKEALSPY